MAQKSVPRNVDLQVFLHRDCGAAKYVHETAKGGPESETTGRHYHTLVAPFLDYKDMLANIPGVENAASMIQQRYIKRLMEQAKGRQNTDGSLQIVNACMDARFNGFLDNMTNATVHRTLGGYLKPLRTKLEVVFGAQNVHTECNVMDVGQLNAPPVGNEKFLAICAPLVISDRTNFSILAGKAGLPPESTYFITVEDDKASAETLFDIDFRVAASPFFHMQGYVLFMDKRNPEPAMRFEKLLRMKRDQFELENLHKKEGKDAVIEYSSQ
ncbi:MAG: hypothetical protein ABR981_02755 [Candidatus Micrarchaeaceae archaeon]|jgi:hypothetical protein